MEKERETRGYIRVSILGLDYISRLLLLWLEKLPIPLSNLE